MTSDSGDGWSFSGVVSPSKRAANDDWSATLGTDFEKNLGTGSEEGAGEAWNVGPAYACSFAGVLGSMCPPRDTGLGFCPETLPMLPVCADAVPLAMLGL